MPILTFGWIVGCLVVVVVVGGGGGGGGLFLTQSTQKHVFHLNFKNKFLYSSRRLFNLSCSTLHQISSCSAEKCARK